MRTQEAHRYGTEQQGGNSPAGGKGQGKQRHQPCFRHAHPGDGFRAFCIPNQRQSLPELAEGYKPEARKPGRPSVEKFDPYKDISEPQHRAALEAAFALKEEYGYKELEDTLIKTYLAEGVS
mgnify:CR=1 FL=1